MDTLSKTLLHLHTQLNEALPYDSIDVDFMNFNQSAHDDREYGFILSKLQIPHHIVVGHYQDPEVIDDIRNFSYVVKAIHYF